MNSHSILGLINDRDRLRRERDRYRSECYIERVLSGVLFVACVAVVVIGAPAGIVLTLASGLALILVFVAGLVWSAKRGDAAMGIGDTQGRDFPAAPNHSTPLSEAHSEGPKDPLQSV